MRLKRFSAAALLFCITSSAVCIAAIPTAGGRGEAVIRGEAADAAGRYLVNASRCGERLSTEWRHPDGTLAASEEVELAEGRWLRYRLQRTNIGQDLRAERRGFDGGSELADWLAAEEEVDAWLRQIDRGAEESPLFEE
jgi:hypothetical protein